jgi:dolichol-phosphate mannosyltransferase
MSNMRPSLSVIIPALNEEADIAAATEEVIKTVGGRFADYELLLFDDGSTDRTGEIMDQLASQNSRIRVTHNTQSHKYGGVYKQGVGMARFDYVLMVPGDNENPSGAVLPVIDAIGKADMVIPYTTNTQVRPMVRRIVSRAYTMLINFLFGQRLKYYNGTFICRTADLRSITITSDSFAYQSEVLVKLLRAGKSYVEVGIQIAPPPGFSSNALKLSNLIGVVKAIFCLFGEIHFQPLRKKRGNQTPPKDQITS